MLIRDAFNYPVIARRAIRSLRLANYIAITMGLIAVAVQLTFLLPAPD